jgi:hypothetical protein
MTLQTQQATPQAEPQQDQNAALLAVIERVATSPDADLAKLEKMIELQERVLDRNAKQAFAAAIAAMQAEIPEVVERGKAHNNTRYANFEDINAAVRPVLQKYGFAITFRIKQLEGSIKVTAVLSHREGHSEETDIVLPSDASGSKNAVQAVGSSVSYGKRYTMSALLNIATRGEDDDAAGAVAVKKVTEFQARAIRERVAKAPTHVKAWMKDNYFSADRVPSDDYNWLIEHLDAAIKTGEKKND